VPTYAYKCRECGNAFDIQQAFSDDALTVCPSCGGALRKVFGTVGVTFNGSGFYRTDSRAGTKSSDTASKGAESGKPKKEPAAAGASSSTSSSDSSASKAPSTPKKAQTPQ
jgi:putative FmdB family regulatory protein